MSEQQTTLYGIFGPTLMKLIEEYVAEKVKEAMCKSESSGNQALQGWIKSALAAKQMGKSVATIHRWVKDGHLLEGIDYKLINGRLYVHEEFIAGNKPR